MSHEGNGLLESALRLLQERFSDEWTVRRREGPAGGTYFDVEGPMGSGSSTILVEPRQSISPRQAQSLISGPLVMELRARTNLAILVVAPFISRKTRAALTAAGVGYLDLTGNVRLSLSYPHVFIDTSGAEKDPQPRKRQTRGVAGAKAGLIVRLLVEASPPFTVTGLTAATEGISVPAFSEARLGVNQGYVSRILEALEGEALISRSSKVVIDVEWVELIRRRAEALDLFDGRAAWRFASKRGPDGVLTDLAGIDDARILVTGSFSARRFNPVTASKLLVAYSPHPSRLAQNIGLLEVEEGADVILIPPRNEVLYLGAQRDSDGVQYASIVQTAIDCLSGRGRLVSEGEALLDWMGSNQSVWRRASLDELVKDYTRG